MTAPLQPDLQRHAYGICAWKASCFVAPRSRSSWYLGSASAVKREGFPWEGFKCCRFSNWRQVRKSASCLLRRAISSAERKDAPLGRSAESWPSAGGGPGIFSAPLLRGGVKILKPWFSHRENEGLVCLGRPRPPGPPCPSCRQSALRGSRGSRRGCRGGGCRLWWGGPYETGGP